LDAHQDARRNKRSSRSCFEFERHLGWNLGRLEEELAADTYQPRDYFTFWVYEPKARLIHAPAFRDRVVQHAIYRVIGPIFERGFIDQSFACRVGMGTHAAADYAQEALQACPRDSYTLKLDVRRFFYRIDRGILRTLVERRIKDRRMVNLMMAFANMDGDVGVPIGNLLSQLYALIYLNPVDHFIKRELKVKWYGRYVDDLMLFGLTRERAAECKEQIETFLRTRLHLEYSKWTIAPLARGVNFVGYRTWAGKRFVRRRSLYNFRRAVRAGRLESVTSILGHAKRTHSLQHMLSHILEKSHALYCRLPKTYRRSHHAGSAPA
jgi:hypothetical protein